MEEGASLLFEGLLEIYKVGEQQDHQRSQHAKDTDSLKSAVNENAGYVNEIVPGNTSPLHGAEGIKFPEFSTSKLSDFFRKSNACRRVAVRRLVFQNFHR